MDVIVERSVALDVHKEQMTACVRLPGADGAREEEVAQFRTTVRGLLTLHDWLEAHRVSQVAMEATGVFWKPVWAVLEDDFELLLVNARHTSSRCRGARPTSPTRPGFASCWRPGCCGRASCRRSRSGRCGTSPATAERRAAA